MGTVILFPAPAAEPPVDPEETLAGAQRRYCLALLADVFGFHFADLLAAIAEAVTVAAQEELVAELEAIEVDIARMAETGRAAAEAVR